MRIRIVQSGGLAGLRRESAVDTEQLPAAVAAELETKVDALGFFDLPARRTRPIPDAILYRIRIERRGHTHEVLVDDQSAGSELLTLVEQVLTGGSPRESSPE